jgi:hypothetical protein
MIAGAPIQPQNYSKLVGTLGQPPSKRLYKIQPGSPCRLHRNPHQIEHAGRVGLWLSHLHPYHQKNPQATQTVETVEPINRDEGQPTWRYYYYAGPARIAMRIKNEETNLVFFLFTDHLGSPNATIIPSLLGERPQRAVGKPEFI